MCHYAQIYALLEIEPGALWVVGEYTTNRDTSPTPEVCLCFCFILLADNNFPLSIHWFFFFSDSPVK